MNNRTHRVAYLYYSLLVIHFLLLAKNITCKNMNIVIKLREIKGDNNGRKIYETSIKRSQKSI